MRARRTRPGGSAPVRTPRTSRRACRRRWWFRCGPRCAASCSSASAGPQPFRPARSRHSESSSMPYGGSVTIRIGLRSPSSRATSSALVAVAAQHAVLAAEPQIAGAGHRILRNGRRQRSLRRSSGMRQQVVDLLGRRSRSG